MQRTQELLLITSTALALIFVGCDKTQSAPEQKATETAKAVEKTITPAAKPKPKQQMFAGAHILISYKGAKRAKPGLTRTKEEALQRAREVAEKARKDPAGFAALAKEYSDGPSGPRGGDLGSWTKGRMVPEFDRAIEQLKVNEVSDPVETGFGYHVMKRNDLPPMYAGAHILISYKGATRARPNITRSKDEAKAKAEQLTKEARTDPSKFADLARKNSDGPSATRGGSLGKWAKGRMVPQFDEAIAKLKVGEISDPVETPFGFHVMRRDDPNAAP